MKCLAGFESFNREVWGSGRESQQREHLWLLLDNL